MCLPISNSESTPFNEKLFRFMDVEGSGSVDLRGFMFITWNFCSFDKHGLASYVYDLVSAEDVQLGVPLTACCSREALLVFYCFAVGSLPDKYGLKAVLSDVYSSRLAEESQEVKALKRIIDKIDPTKVTTYYRLVWCTSAPAHVHARRC